MKNIELNVLKELVYHSYILSLQIPQEFKHTMIPVHDFDKCIKRRYKELTKCSHISLSDTPSALHNSLNHNMITKDIHNKIILVRLECSIQKQRSNITPELDRTREEPIVT